MTDLGSLSDDRHKVNDSPAYACSTLSDPEHAPSSRRAAARSSPVRYADVLDASKCIARLVGRNIVSFAVKQSSVARTCRLS
jgi:hypothetical protein